MENQKIAELVSKKIYNVSETETDFAVQLLIEKLIIPEDVKIYTTDDAKKYILEALRIHDVSNRRELLCAFFKYFRDNGEANIGMTIEEFVDGFLSTQ